jgi:hypothetical protein
MAEPKYMKRKVKSGAIELDPEDRAIIVNYEVEATVLGDLGEAMQVERKSHQKKIRLKTLNEHTNIQLLSEEIVDKCKMIHPSKLPLVEKLLAQLQQRQLDKDNHAPSQKEIERKKRKKERASSRGRGAEEKKSEEKEEESTASMEDLDNYMEKLYEESSAAKIEATGAILDLTKTAGNLETLIGNEALMGNLSRTFGEEYRKGGELISNIIRIFWSFSNFVQMHEILANYKIGSLTLKLVEYEIKRAKLMEADADKLKAQEKGDVEREDKEDKDSRRKRDKKLAHAEKSRKEKGKKQDKRLYVCFSVLMNLAEDVHNERKMVKKELVAQLIGMLDRLSPELLILVVTFLKKLSIFEQNKNTMADQGIVQNLAKFIPCSNEKLMQVTLRLLFNLSFDPEMRDLMVEASLIPKLVELLKRPPFRAITLRLLYHLSVEDRCKNFFFYTEAIPITMQLVINFPQKKVARELVALAINLSSNKRNAERMCRGEGLGMLVQRVLQTRDALLMKVIRNISQWTLAQQTSDATPGEYEQAGMWSGWVAPLLELAQNTEEHELLVEVLGTLGNFTPADLGPKTSWSELVHTHSLVPFIRKLLVPGFLQDDIVLEVVILIGSIALDEELGPTLASSHLIAGLKQLLREKCDDDEMVLQIMFTYYRLIAMPEPMEEFLYGTRAIDAVLDATSSHTNSEVVILLDMVLEQVMDADRPEDTREVDEAEEQLGEIAVKVRQRRFQAYNADWLEHVEQEEAAEGESLAEEKAYLEAQQQHDDDMSGSDEEDGQWGSIGGRRENIAMDMGMLEDNEWDDSGEQ